MLRWLHLTDLHIKDKPTEFRTEVETKFFRDLVRHNLEGAPIDLVLVTGDITNSGSDLEFAAARKFFDHLLGTLEGLQKGVRPILLAVPGNHDLRRSVSCALANFSEQWHSAGRPVDWYSNPNDGRFESYRLEVKMAFAPYLNWWNKTSASLKRLVPGQLPGDFSWTFTKDNLRLGVIGLNSAFLGLTDLPSQGKLGLGLDQFDKATSGNFAIWAQKIDVCLLLTHHPPTWLSPGSQRSLEGALGVAQGAWHLFGHLHLPDSSVSLTTNERRWQGRSLFGVGTFPDEFQGGIEERSHGYSIGEIGEISAPTPDGSHFVRFFPRRYVAKQNNQWQFEREVFLTEPDQPYTEAYPTRSPLRQIPQPTCKWPRHHPVSKTYLATHNGKTYREILDDFTQVLGQAGPTALERLRNATISALVDAPPETFLSEHLLTTIRRRIHAAVATLLDDRERQLYRLGLLEPALVYGVERQARNRTRPEAAGGPQQGQTRAQIRYQIARLLAEMGDFHSSLYLFDRALEKSATNPQLNIMARNGKAVVMQNLGIYEEAERILEEILREEPRLDPNLRYFTKKHYATLLRRIDPGKNCQRSLQLLEEAGRDACTYHLHFSRGFIYLLTGQYAEAKGQFEKCSSELGEDAQDYYFLHLPYALCMLETGGGSTMEEIQARLEMYERAVKTNGNFKTGIHDFIHKLLHCVSGSGTFSAEPLVAEANNLPRLLDSREKLVAFQAEWLILKRHYQAPTARAQVATAIDRQLIQVSDRFRGLDRPTGRQFFEAPSISRQREALLVLVQATQGQKTDDAPHPLSQALDLLTRNVRTYLASDFDEVTFRGSGFLLAKWLPEPPTGHAEHFVTEFLGSFFQKLALAETQLKVDSLQLGVGVACGTYTSISLGDQTFAEGRGPILAEKMARRSKPFGVVIDAQGSIPDLSAWLAPYKRLRRIKINDHWVYCSPEVLHAPSQSFFQQHVAGERRLFVNLGSRCTRNCLYCDSREVWTQANEFNAERFTRELRELVQDHSLDGYLFSFGFFNEPLQDGNRQATAQAIRIICGNTGAAVQVATKCLPGEIRKFISDLEGVGVNPSRVALMYSLTTIEHAAWLEPGQANTRAVAKELVSLAREKRIQIVPYVKPFLPGITDKDAELKEFLSCFKQVVVGYPYFSRQTMWTMATQCMKRGLDDALPYYDYTARLAAGSLALTAPCSDGAALSSFNYQKELNSFRDELRGNNKVKTVFISSPCVTAYAHQTTCYTHVGRKGPLRGLLCTGDDSCPNAGCIYNHKHPSYRNRVDRLAWELRLTDHLLRDRAHAFDHLCRVDRTAQALLERYQAEGNAAVNEAQRELLRICCLVHDLGDPKLTDTLDRTREVDLRASSALAALTLVGIEDQATREAVAEIITTFSFDDYLRNPTGSCWSIPAGRLKGNDLIGRLLFDADAIDAMGPIGIARCFSFRKNTGIFDPGESPRPFDQMARQPCYRSAIIHFFEKLIHLHSLLLPSSQRFAAEHHAFLVGFLCRFLQDYSVGLDAGERQGLRSNIDAFLRQRSTLAQQDRDQILTVLT